MLNKQGSLMISNYSGIYDIVVPKDNMLRQINEMVDFTFVYDELKDKYSRTMGRGAESPVKLFKYLLLKTIFDLSDRAVVERSRYDMSFKYFLDMAPEEDVIDPSLLTHFRRQRLKDMDLLDMLITKTVHIAIEKDLIRSKTAILDATHTLSRYNKKSPTEYLRDKAKVVRKAIYKVDESMKEKFPKKPTSNEITDTITYCQDLIETIEKEEKISHHPQVSDRLDQLKEIVGDIEDELDFAYSNDADAKTGYKSADNAFFGYKTHLAINEERIITAAVVTTGEANDGKFLSQLVDKSMENGMEIEDIIADGAYSAKTNIEYANENNMKLVSKLNSMVSVDGRKLENRFDFNKDAGLFMCKAGHLAKSKQKIGRSSNGNPRIKYVFDVEQCKVCPLRDGCYNGTKQKTYTVTIRSDVHLKQKEFQESDYFKEKSKERYKIEAKNSELKNRHGYGVTQHSGLLGMQIQSAMAIFTVNLKRIMKLEELK